MLQMRLWPETHFPTNWYHAASYFMYRFITPGMAQFAQRQINEMGGHNVLPVATWVAAPFPIE